MTSANGMWACPSCGFELWLPVEAPALSSTRLGLYDDGRFPGRCLVVHREHHEHLDALSEAALSGFWADVAQVGGAVRRLTGAARVNYAVLGNGTRHLHAHVIPRQPAAEDLPTRPPWNDPRPLIGLPPQELLSLQNALARVLR